MQFKLVILKSDKSNLWLNFKVDRYGPEVRAAILITSSLGLDQMQSNSASDLDSYGLQYSIIDFIYTWQN